MLNNIENNALNSIALGLIVLIILMLVSATVPTLLLEWLGVPRKVTKNFVGIFALFGFFLWIYLMFYLNLSELIL